MVAEHAMLAAQAVADAEEASKKASSLLHAANELEDLHHRHLQARHGEPLRRLLFASVHCTPCGAGSCLSKFRPVCFRPHYWHT